MIFETNKMKHLSKISVFSWFSKLWKSFLFWLGVRKLSFRDKLPNECKDTFDEILKMKKEYPNANFQIKTKKLAKNKNWVVHFDDIDSSLISEIQFPEISYSHTVNRIVSGSMCVHLYETENFSTFDTLQQILKKEEVELTVEFFKQSSKSEISKQIKMIVYPRTLHLSESLVNDENEPIEWILSLDCLEIITKDSV